MVGQAFVMGKGTKAVRSVIRELLLPAQLKIWGPQEVGHGLPFSVSFFRWSQ